VGLEEGTRKESPSELKRKLLLLNYRRRKIRKQWQVQDGRKEGNTGISSSNSPQEKKTLNLREGAREEFP